jgi:hypothetical protein
MFSDKKYITLDKNGKWNRYFGKNSYFKKIIKEQDNLLVDNAYKIAMLEMKLVGI